MVATFRDRTAKPLFVKLPPFVTSAERDAVLALAATVLDAGADGLTCSNTRLVADTRLAVGRGGRRLKVVIRPDLADFLIDAGDLREAEVWN